MTCTCFSCNIERERKAKGLTSIPVVTSLLDRIDATIAREKRK